MPQWQTEAALSPVSTVGHSVFSWPPQWPVECCRVQDVSMAARVNIQKQLTSAWCSPTQLWSCVSNPWGLKWGIQFAPWASWWDLSWKSRGYGWGIICVGSWKSYTGGCWSPQQFLKIGCMAKAVLMMNRVSASQSVLFMCKWSVHYTDWI